MRQPKRRLSWDGLHLISAAGSPALSSNFLHIEDVEDVQSLSTPRGRRVLRSHYQRLKAFIAEHKDQLLSAYLNEFDEIFRRLDNLYTFVHRPREQIADAEALLDITEAFVKSVNDSCGIKVADLVSRIIQNFSQPGHVNATEASTLDWAAIGHLANAIFHDAPGMGTISIFHVFQRSERISSFPSFSPFSVQHHELLLRRDCNHRLGSLHREPKRRKVLEITRKRERGSVAEATCPETVGDREGEEQSQTNKSIRTMFKILRLCGDGGCQLEHLILSRESFSHTVENIFCLSFLVKDGLAQISIEDGKQIVALRHAKTAAERSEGSKGGGEQRQVVNTQFVFRFDFKEWPLMKDMVEVGTELMPERMQGMQHSESASIHSYGKECKE